MAYNINFTNGSGQIELFDAQNGQIDVSRANPHPDFVRTLQERARAIVQACQMNLNSLNSRIVVEIDLRGGTVQVIGGGIAQDARSVAASLMPEEQAQIKGEDIHWPDAPTVFDLGKSMLNVFRVARAEGNTPSPLRGIYMGHPNVPQGAPSHQHQSVGSQRPGQGSAVGGSGQQLGSHQGHRPGSSSSHHQPASSHSRRGGSPVQPHSRGSGGSSSPQQRAAGSSPQRPASSRSRRDAQPQRRGTGASSSTHPQVGAHGRRTGSGKPEQPSKATRRRRRRRKSAQGQQSSSVVRQSQQPSRAQRAQTIFSGIMEWRARLSRKNKRVSEF